MRNRRKFIKKIIDNLWFSEVACILFHRIKGKNKVYVLDKDLQKPYRRYKCQTCGREYLANSIRDWYRIEYQKKFKKKKI